MLREVPLHRDLIEALVEMTLETGENPTDLSGIRLVFPGKRMGVFFRHALARRLQNPCFPPRIFPIEGFVDHLFELNFPGRRSLDPVEATMVVYRLLREKDPATLYTGKDSLGSFPDFFPWGLKITQALESILVESRNLEEIDLRVFRDFVDLGQYHRSYSAFITALPELARSFCRYLEENKKKTRGSMYRGIVRTIEGECFRMPPACRTIFAGFNALNHSEERILSHFFHHTDALLVIRRDPGEKISPRSPFSLQEKTVQALSLESSSQPSSSSSDEESWTRFTGRVSLHPATNRESEMAAVYKELRTQVENLRPEELIRVGVVLPDPAALIPFIQGVVSRFAQEEQPLPFNITLGYPFQRTPLFQLIHLMLTAGEVRRDSRIPAGEYLALVRHPYVKLSGAPNEEDPVRQGIHAIEDLILRENLVSFAPHLLPERLEKTLKVEKKEQILSALKDLHQRFLLDGALDFSGLCRQLRTTLREMARNHSRLFFDEYLAAALQALEELQHFQEEEPEAFRGASFSRSAAFIRHYLSRCRVHFEGSPLRGIQVMGLLEFRGLKFDSVLVVDAVEGTLPENRKYDPLLPPDIRRVFGMRHYTDWENLYSFHFFSLLAGARESRIFWPRKQDTLFQEAEASRFIERILYESEQKGQAVSVHSTDFPLRIGESESRKIHKTAEVRKMLREMCFSPSSLQLYLHCPLRFYYQRVLKLKEKEEITESPEAGPFGSMLHEILQSFYAPLLRGKPPPETGRPLREMIEKIFAKNHYRMDSGMIRIRAWMVEERLRDFLESDRRRILDPKRKIRIHGLEEKIREDLEPGDSGRLRVRGIIDRLEQMGEEWRIIDYKSGSPLRGDRPDRAEEDFSHLHQLPDREYLEKLTDFRRIFPSFQLLLYCLMVTKQKGIPRSAISGVFVYLREPSSRDRERNIFQQRKFTTSGLKPQEFLSRFQSALDALHRDILERDHFPAHPGDHRYCTHCPYIHLCGKNPA